MKAFAICPLCGERIRCRALKDFESYTKEEYADHVDKSHPDAVTRVGEKAVSVPYACIEFE